MTAPAPRPDELAPPSPGPTPVAGTVRKRLKLGRIHADHLTFAQALDEIVAAARRGEGGFVVTPNVDHVVLAEDDEELVACYREALLSLVDGMPLLWLSRVLGHPLPEKISGSDLVAPLCARAAEEGLGVYLLGAREGVGARAAERLIAEHPGLKVVGVHSPPLGFEKDPDVLDHTLARVREAHPHLVLVALGCPKQEKFMRAHARHLAPAVLLGIGATLDFLAGEVRRAPAWMSRAGLEWAYRLAQEPTRMAERYLVRDRAIGGIAARMLRAPWEERAEWC